MPARRDDARSDRPDRRNVNFRDLSVSRLAALRRPAGWAPTWPPPRSAARRCRVSVARAAPGYLRLPADEVHLHPHANPFCCETRAKDFLGERYSAPSIRCCGAARGAQRGGTRIPFLRPISALAAKLVKVARCRVRRRRNPPQRGQPQSSGQVAGARDGAEGLTARHARKPGSTTQRSRHGVAVPAPRAVAEQFSAVSCRRRSSGQACSTPRSRCARRTRCCR